MRVKLDHFPQGIGVKRETTAQQMTVSSCDRSGFWKDGLCATHDFFYARHDTVCKSNHISDNRKNQQTTTTTTTITTTNKQQKTNNDKKHKFTTIATTATTTATATATTTTTTTTAH